MHPVLETLRNTDKQWLIDTLYAFNGGNVEKFQSFKSAWGQQVIHTGVAVTNKHSSDVLPFVTIIVSSITFDLTFHLYKPTMV